VSSLDLIVFLQQRIADDKEAARRLAAEGADLILGGLWAAAVDANAAAQAMLAVGDPDRALREAAAKEELLERYINSTRMHVTSHETVLTGTHRAVLADTLVAVAAIYRDHPDHQVNWFEDED
jgi:hypothetical protein